MDLPGAMEPPEVMGVLGLDKITDKPWHIQYVDFPFSFRPRFATVHPLPSFLLQGQQCVDRRGTERRRDVAGQSMCREMRRFDTHLCVAGKDFIPPFTDTPLSLTVVFVSIRTSQV